MAHYNNTEGTFQCLEFCRKNNIKKFVYMSSSRILSKEENPYTASKKYGEHLCEAYKQCYGIQYIIIRPSTVYGSHHDLTTRLITKWIINAMTGKPLEIYGDADKTLDFTHIDDFVDGIELLINSWNKAKNKAFDICGNDCRTLVELANIIENKLGKPIKRIFLEPERAQPQHVSIDISKIKDLGYKPKIKLEEGISKVIEFYKGDGKKWLKN